MDLRKLAEPFPASDVEWRLQSSGKKANGDVWARVLAYITNRAIMQRLDDVCGPGGWRNEYVFGPDGAVLCGISIFIREPDRDPEWVTKWDGAENTDIEAVKGGLSGAMKRSGVQWGIGRYLYELEEGYAKISERGEHYAKTKDGTAFKWDAPALPAWALPGGSGKPGVKAEPKAAAEKSTTGARRASQEDVGTQPPNAPSAVSAPIAADLKPDDVRVGDKRLGDYTDTELRALAERFKAEGKKGYLKAVNTVLTNRSLGMSPRPELSADEQVARMKAGVAAETASLPFT